MFIPRWSSSSLVVYHTLVVYPTLFVYLNLVVHHTLAVCPSLVACPILVVYPTLVVYPKLVVYPTLFVELSVLDQLSSRRLMFGVRLSTSRCLRVSVLMYTSMPCLGALRELSLHLPTHVLFPPHVLPLIENAFACTDKWTEFLGHITDQISEATLGRGLFIISLH